VTEISNITPSFAREASQLLLDGYIQRATELCIAGTQKFPTYATGFLVLGKCYDAAGKNAEALAAYRESFARLPDNAALEELVRRADDKERQVLQLRREEERKKLEAEVEARQRFESDVEQRVKTEVQHKLDVREQVSRSPERPIGTQEEESNFDYLTRVLQNAKGLKPNPTAAAEKSREGDGRNIADGARNLSFVTPTMAEIYVSQGEYKVAINAYQELLRQHPFEEKYKQRIADIEKLMVVQEKEKS
jgi:tetratricopeptide (TPR) repeat protein